MRDEFAASGDGCPGQPVTTGLSEWWVSARPSRADTPSAPFPPLLEGRPARTEECALTHLAFARAGAASRRDAGCWSRSLLSLQLEVCPLCSPSSGGRVGP